jgi:hypothetical protein
MAAVPPLGGIPGAARTFCERCADESYDPYQGAYGPAFEAFKVPLFGDDQHHQLTAKVLSSPLTAPMYFLACVPYTPGRYRVVVVHHPFIYRAPFGQPDEYDGGGFALTGDVIDGQMPAIIEWPQDLLQSVTPPDVRVTTMSANALLTYFQDNPDAEWVPAVIPPGPGRLEVYARKAVFCPTFLAQKLIDKVLTPRTAFLTIVEELAIRNQILSCSSILSWLVVTCMSTLPTPAVAAPVVVVPVEVAPAVAAATQPMDPTDPAFFAPREAAAEAETVAEEGDEVQFVQPPVAEAELALAAAVRVPRTATQYFQRMPAITGLTREVVERVHRELLGLVAPTTPVVGGGAALGASEQVSTAMLQALQSIAAGQQRPVAAAAAVTPRSVYGTSMVNLLRVVQVAEDADLPQFWTDLARASRSQQISTIANRFGVVAGRLNVNPPIVTKAVQDFFVQLRFQFIDRNNLLDGLSPFLFPPLNSMQRGETTGTYRNYMDVVMAGTLTMREAEEMEARDRRAVPIYTLTEMREALSGFHVFVHTLFERNTERTLAVHEYLENWDALWEQIRDNDRIWEDELVIKGRAFEIVRWVHLKSSIWAQQQVKSEVLVAPPDLTPLWQAILEGNGSWVSRGGPGHAAYGWGGPPSAQPVAPKLSPASGGSGGGGGGQPRAQKSGDKRKFLSAEDRIENPAKIKALMDMGSAGISKAVEKGKRTNDPPPMTKHDPSSEYCFGWHLKGFCYKTCTRVADHVVHSTEDREAMTAWLRRNF